MIPLLNAMRASLILLWWMYLAIFIFGIIMLFTCENGFLKLIGFLFVIVPAVCYIFCFFTVFIYLFSAVFIHI